MEFEATREFAVRMDDADPLRGFRDRFNFPPARDGREPVYLCGNSLGLQPKLAVQYVAQELEDWAKLAVHGHFSARRPWMPYHRLAVDGFAALAGAERHEVVAMNTLTVNLHLLMTTFYRPTPDRHAILIESTAFPSDRFAAMSQIRVHGFDPADGLIEWAPRDRDDTLYLEDLQQILDTRGERIALLLLPGVQYYSGQLLDMAALCAMARRAGCNIGLDLAHAIGNVPLAMHEWGADFAAWCTYKYLNAGPGAVAGAFVHARHLDADGSEQLLGWWGHDEATRFRMAPSFTPASGADLWQLSNPPILSLAPVLASLELFGEAGIDRLREKSLKLTGFLEFLLRERFTGRVESITPADARGCQLSLVVVDPALQPKRVFERLESLNVTGDWREPNVIRVAPVPLYNSFSDVYEFTRRLAAATESS